MLLTKLLKNKRLKKTGSLRAKPAGRFCRRMKIFTFLIITMENPPRKTHILFFFHFSIWVISFRDFWKRQQAVMKIVRRQSFNTRYQKFQDRSALLKQIGHSKSLKPSWNRQTQTQAALHAAHKGSEIAPQIFQAYKEVPINSSSHFEMDFYSAATMDL